MKGTTIRYQNDGSIELREVDVADPGIGEIQVAGGACGICSWDIVTAKLGDRMKPMAPPGHEGMGYVVKVGPNVTGFKEGDRIAGGGFATLRNLPAARAYKLPASELADNYWIVEPVSCIVTGLDHCRLRPGDRVVLIGCGFMGLMLLQGLLHSFAEQVTVVDIAPERLALAQQLGATEVYNSAQEDGAELAQSLKARTIDVVVDTSGSQAGLDLAADVVKRGGIINLFGWIKGQTATFDPTKWHTGGFTVVNSSPSSQLRDPFPPAIQLLHKGIIDLRPLVTHVAPLQEYPTLMGQILAGDKGYVKGVVTLA
jgi:threonine dehydrogenase-like Zn-dependent dehydrogenase